MRFGLIHGSYNSSLLGELTGAGGKEMGILCIERFEQKHTCSSEAIPDLHPIKKWWISNGVGPGNRAISHDEFCLSGN